MMESDPLYPDFKIGRRKTLNFEIVYTGLRPVKDRHTHCTRTTQYGDSTQATNILDWASPSRRGVLEIRAQSRVSPGFDVRNIHSAGLAKIGPTGISARNLLPYAGTRISFIQAPDRA